MFVDGPNDGGLETGPNDAECAKGLMWRTSVVQGDDVGQWQHIPSVVVATDQPESSEKSATEPRADGPGPTDDQNEGEPESVEVPPESKGEPVKA